MTKEGVCQDVTWTVVPVGYQSITKRCPSCEAKRLFYPAGTFRVNAHKKNIDVWNIYKCEKCHCTWNIDIISRVTIGDMDSELYECFLRNDKDQVYHFSYRYDLLKKNQVELGPVPDVVIEGPSLEDLCGQVMVHVVFKYPISIRLIKLLARKLSLSRGQINHLVECGVLGGIKINELNKKIKQSISFKMDLDHLRTLPHADSEGNRDRVIVPM